MKINYIDVVEMPCYEEAIALVAVERLIGEE